MADQDLFPLLESEVSESFNSLFPTLPVNSTSPSTSNAVDADGWTQNEEGTKAKNTCIPLDSYIHYMKIADQHPIPPLLGGEVSESLNSTSPSISVEVDADDWDLSNSGDWTQSEEWAEREKKVRAAYTLLGECNSWESVFRTFRQARLNIPQHIAALATWSPSPWDDTRAIREAFIRTGRVNKWLTWDDVVTTFTEAGMTIPEELWKQSSCNTMPWIFMEDIYYAFYDAVIKYAKAKEALALASVEPPRFSKFTCFSSLPTEIRLQIWKHNLPGPRLVVLRYNWNDYEPYDFTSTARIPTNLHVNRESRAEALKIYKLCFAPSPDAGNDRLCYVRTTDSPEKVASLPPPKTFFNYELDTVIFAQKNEAPWENVSNNFLFKYVSDADLESIQNMMVMRPLDSRWPPRFWFAIEGMTALLKNLKKVTLLFASHSIRADHLLNSAPVEELAIGDRSLDPNEYSDFFRQRGPVEEPLTAADLQDTFDREVSAMEDYLKEHASVASWTQVPVVTMAKPADPNRQVNSILDLCF